MRDTPPDLVEAARAARRVVVLTGAGMSAESGIPTFRGTRSGLWERFDPMALASPSGWAADPELVWGWYLWRVGLVRAAQPNAGHVALAQWARSAPVRVVTQNVDDLHERAGSADVVHLHGSIVAFRCSECGAPYDSGLVVAAAAAASGRPALRVAPPRCPVCAQGLVRPGVVWFGESLPLGAFEAAVAAVEEADLVLVVGTSGLVHPAAQLPMVARQVGAFVGEINPEPTQTSGLAHEVWRSTAASAIPVLIHTLWTPPCKDTPLEGF
ncbi:MAG: NAD-dependent protein deacylase [Dermatophilaceae bacterium]